MNYLFIIFMAVVLVSVTIITINSFKEERKAKAVFSLVVLVIAVCSIIVAVKNQLGLMNGLQSTSDTPNQLYAGIAMGVVAASQLMRTVSDFKKEGTSSGRKAVDVVTVVIAVVACAMCLIRHFGIL